MILEAYPREDELNDIPDIQVWEATSALENLLKFIRSMKWKVFWLISNFGLSLLHKTMYLIQKLYSAKDSILVKLNFDRFYTIQPTINIVQWSTVVTHIQWKFSQLLVRRKLAFKLYMSSHWRLKTKFAKL